MARLGRPRPTQPDEAYGMAVERTLQPHADPDDTFDQPDLDVILQREELPLPKIIVPVELVKSIAVPIATLPLAFDSAGTLQIAGGAAATPVRLLNEDKRRGQISLAATAATRIARSQAEVSNARSSFRLIAAYGVVRFRFIDELWVVGDTGTATVTWVTEAWTD